MIKNKKILKLAVKLMATLIFLWWIIFKINWNEVWEYLQKVSLIEIIFYIILYFLGIGISSYKWKFLANSKKIIGIPWRKFFKYYFAATFINNFMPSFVGGDAFKSYQIGKFDKKYKEAVSSVFIDRLTGLWGAMILALIFSILNIKIILENKILLLINLGIVVILLASWLFFRKISLLKIVPFSKVRNFLENIRLEITNNDSRFLTKAILLSFIFNFIGLAGANYILFLAMDISVNVINYLSVIFLISIISSVPISINNIGVKEWAYVTFFGFFGIVSSAVLAVALLSRILQMILSLFSWPIYLRNK